jgi:hypothetical protein
VQNPECYMDFLATLGLSKYMRGRCTQSPYSNSPRLQTGTLHPSLVTLFSAGGRPPQAIQKIQRSKDPKIQNLTTPPHRHHLNTSIAITNTITLSSIFFLINPPHYLPYRLPVPLQTAALCPSEHRHQQQPLSCRPASLAAKQ